MYIANMIFLIQKEFTWPPDHMRRNFEKRGASKMSQLIQDVHKDLEYNLDWMGDEVWEKLMIHRNSSKFKKVYEQIKEIVFLWMVHLFTLEELFLIVCIGIK